ncbi:MAG: tetratricopeptide repeat protein [Chitinophagaceae bacterium]|nr:tetratricopeptide repeat protein [Chitinophagaceae bacterium]
MNKIDSLLKFLKHEPEDSFLNHALALEYEKLGDYDHALTLFKKILERDPDYIGSYYHLGKLLEIRNDYKAAMEWYERGMAKAKATGDTKKYNELKEAYDDIAD